MTEYNRLPAAVVDELKKAEIPRNSIIFCHNNHWIYQTHGQLTGSEQLLLNPIDSLGPFDLHKVNVTFILHPDTSRYTITNIEGLELRDENTATGVFGPIAQITLKGFARDTAKIPDNATHFCWFYQPNDIRINDDIIRDKLHALRSLELGGFAYFVGSENNLETLQLVCVNSLIVSAKNGLTFEGPKAWKSEFTQQLWNQNRFQPVTLPNLFEKGAKYFAFINPDEPFIKENHPTSWKPSSNGAFVYLFTDDHSPHPFDCFFSVADNCLGVAPSDD